MIQIVIPASGNGQRFKDAGYEEPKHLIPVLGVPMIKRVLACIVPDQDYSVQVITKDKLKSPSRGAVETILNAHINPNEPLLIANCDQLVDIDVEELMNTELDGVIATFESVLPHHSYVKTDEYGIITEIKEKEVISHQAVTGVYYFSRAEDFIEASKAVIATDERVKGEFYVSSALAKMIRDGKKLTTYDCPSVMLGTPAELRAFEIAVHYGESHL